MVPLFTRRRHSKLVMVVKIIAAFAALIPFLGSLVQLKEKFSDSERMQKVLNDSRFFLITCFGISYAATNDITATTIAMVFAYSIFELGKAEEKK